MISSLEYIILINLKIQLKKKKNRLNIDFELSYPNVNWNKLFTKSVKLPLQFSNFLFSIRDLTECN